jgi:proline iminopeptidase
MKAKIRDTELFFDVEGAAIVVEGDRIREKPVAFLLHGGPGADHTSYKPIFSALADRMQLVYIDHRGQGRSARGLRSTYTLDNNVEDLEALRQYLGLGPIIVIGGSYGGMVAMAYAARYSHSVSHLIAYATAPSYEFLAKAQQTLRDRGTPEQIAIAQKLWDGTFQSNEELKSYFEVLAPVYSYRSIASSPDWSDRILSYEATNEAFGGFLRTYDIRSELPNIIAPTLVLAGRHDWICAPEFSEEIARLIPQADLRIFEESGHMLRTDEPQKLLDAIAGFLVYQTRVQVFDPVTNRLDGENKAKSSNSPNRV